MFKELSHVIFPFLQFHQNEILSIRNVILDWLHILHFFQLQVDFSLFTFLTRVKTNVNKPMYNIEK